MPYIFIAIFVLILLNAFFAGTEIAIISARSTKLKSLAEKDVKSAKLILDYHKKPSEFLSTIQVGVTLAGFFVSAISAAYLSTSLAEAIKPLAGRLSAGISLAFVTIVVSFLTLVFSEVLPKHLAIVNPESFALSTARPLKIISYFLAPFSKIVSFTTNSIVKLLGYEPSLSQKTISEEELQLLVAEQQDFYPEEKEIIQEALEIGDVTVRQIMVPRNDIIAIPSSAIVDEALTVSNKVGHTRLPVFEEDLDNIIGMVHIKDAISELRKDKQDRNVKDILRPVLYIPETNKALVALKQLQKSGLHLAVALDEYGGTSGILTIEDIVEEIFGEIRDEYDMELELIKPVSKDTFIILGKAPVQEINESIGTDIPESPDYETIAGWLIYQFNRIPKQNEIIDHKGFKFTINKMKQNRIESVLVKKTRL